MSTLDPPAGWPTIDGIDVTERLLGGVDGPLNRAAVGLVARTKQLLDTTNSLSTDTAGLGDALTDLQTDVSALSASVSAFVATLASSAGATQIGYTAGPTVAAALTRLDNKTKTVNDYGAVMDGVTNDSAAFAAMAAATNGVIVLQAGEYYVGNLILPLYDDLIIVGAGQPMPNAEATRSQGGSIVIGGINARSRRPRLANFGLDLGTARGYDTTVGIDGLVINAPVGQTGSYFSIHNITSVGPGDAGSSHRILVQGFNGGDADNNIVTTGQYGLVAKCRNFNIGRTFGQYLRTACVYPKSDTPEFGGDVGDASAGNFNIGQTINICRSTNTECVGVYVHASTLPLNKGNVGPVYQLYGHSPGRVQGAGTLGGPSTSGITFSQLVSESAQHGFFAGGYNYDWTVAEVHAINPQTGRLWYMDTSTNWRILAGGVLITNSALPTTFGNMQGWGAVGMLYARRTDAQMVISISAVPSAIKQFQTGFLSGNLRYSMDQALVGQNGAVADTTRPPTFRLAPGGKAELAGRFAMDAATNKFFCNLPITTGLEYAYPGSYIDNAGHYQPCVIRLNSFQLSLEVGNGTLPSNPQFVILDGISITM